MSDDQVTGFVSSNALCEDDPLLARLVEECPYDMIKIMIRIIIIIIIIMHTYIHTDGGLYASLDPPVINTSLPNRLKHDTTNVCI